MKYEILKILESEGDMQETDLLNHFLGKDPWRAKITLDGLAEDGYINRYDTIIRLSYKGMVLVWDRDELLEKDLETRILSIIAIAISLCSLLFNLV